VQGPLKPHFDLSSFPKDHDMYDASGEGVMGLFKIEHDKPLAEVVAIRSKMYSLLIDGTQKSACKGVTRHVQRTILHENYLECLFHGNDPRKQSQRRQFYSLQTHKHNLRIRRMDKVAISSFNDKSYLMPDGSQLPWGHARTVASRP
jgi:hypothetical protein